MTDTDERSFSGTVFSPPELSMLTVNMVKEKAKRPGYGVPFGIPDIDGYITSMQPGDMVPVIGRPSNFKSGFMQYVARNEALRIMAGGEERKDEYVAFVTWEQSVEHMTLFELAAKVGESATNLIQGHMNGKYSELIKASITRSNIPLWIIGHSTQVRRRRPGLSIEDVYDAIYFIEDEMGKRPSLIVLDYLQAIPVTDSRIQPRLFYGTIVDKVKDLGMIVGCPTMLGTQARRDVDYRDVKIPSLADGMETSTIEHRADIALAVCMPKMYYRVGDDLPAEYGIPMVVDSRTVLLAVLKQKFGPAGSVFPLRVIPEQNRII